MIKYCRERGYEEVFVQADKVDDYAIDFYRATPITAEEEVVHFYYSLGKK
jgi:aminoglycoside 3-N-acetyltransferase I